MLLLSSCTPQYEVPLAMTVRYQDAQGNPQSFSANHIGDHTTPPIGLKYQSDFPESVIPNSSADGEISCTFNRKLDSVELYRFGAEFAPDDWLTLDSVSVAAEPLTREHGSYSIPDPEPECTYWVKANYGDSCYITYLIMVTDVDVTTVKNPRAGWCDMTGTFLESTGSGVRILVTEANFFKGQELELALAEGVDFSGVNPGDSLHFFYTIDYPGNVYTIVHIETIEPDES